MSKNKKKYDRIYTKYIEELGIKKDQTPWSKHHKDSRMKNWKRERQLIGIDERESWCLACTLDMLIYSRLMYYLEFCIGGFDPIMIEHNGESIPQKDAIERIVSGLKILILDEDGINCDIHRQEIYSLLGAVHQSLWW